MFFFQTSGFTPELTWNIIPWRFGSDHVPFLNGVMAVGEPAVHLPGCITGPYVSLFKLLSMPGFIINKPPRRKTFQTWRQVLRTETRKVKAKNAGAVKVLRAQKLIFAGNFSTRYDLMT